MCSLPLCSLGSITTRRMSSWTCFCWWWFVCLLLWCVYKKIKKVKQTWKTLNSVCLTPSYSTQQQGWKYEDCFLPFSGTLEVSGDTALIMKRIFCFNIVTPVCLTVPLWSLVIFNFATPILETERIRFWGLKIIYIRLSLTIQQIDIF